MNFPLQYKAKALLFDMDGTILDSTLAVEQAWRNFAQRNALNINKVLDHIHGRRAAETVEFFTPDHLEETSKVTTEELFNTENIVAIAGVSDLLHKIPSYAWAVVTSADRELAISRISAAKLPIPNVLITAEDVLKGKPAPDGYLAAAKILNVKPQDCLVFEDSVVGLMSAHAANMQVIAIGKHIPSGYTKNELWIEDFTHINFSNLGENIYQVNVD